MVDSVEDCGVLAESLPAKDQSLAVDGPAEGTANLPEDPTEVEDIEAMDILMEDVKEEQQLPKKPLSSDTTGETNTEHSDISKEPSHSS